MTTDLAPTTPGLVPGDLDARLRFVSALADAGALPPAFRKRPADLLLVASYADDLGLGFASALSSLYVVDGKVTLSASLVASLVRRAGHRLRTTTTYDADGRPTIVATIVRADDPGWSAVSTWDLERAGRAGLAARDTWRKYPEQMLRARAITEAAREACPEVLSGLYLADEVAADPVPGVVERTDAVDDSPRRERPSTAADATRDAMGYPRREDRRASPGQLRAIGARLGAIGVRDAEHRSEVVRIVLGRERRHTSARQMTAVEASAVLEASADDLTAAAELAWANLTSTDPDADPHAPDDVEAAPIEAADVEEVVDAILEDDADPDGIVEHAVDADVVEGTAGPSRAAGPPARPTLSSDAAAVEGGAS